MKEKHYKELRISCNPEQTKAAAHACSTFRHGGLIVFVFPRPFSTPPPPRFSHPIFRRLRAAKRILLGAFGNLLSHALCWFSIKSLFINVLLATKANG